VFDGLLHPHSSIPYVQMGRSIVLYTVSLLSRDSCERVCGSICVQEVFSLLIHCNCASVIQLQVRVLN